MLKQCNECRIEFHGLSFSNGFHATFDLIFVFVGSSYRFTTKYSLLFEVHVKSIKHNIPKFLSIFLFRTSGADFLSLSRTFCEGWLSL